MKQKIYPVDIIHANIMQNWQAIKTYTNIFFTIQHKCSMQILDLSLRGFKFITIIWPVQENQDP